MAADAVRLIGVADHSGGNASTLQGEVHLLPFLIGDALIDFAVHE